VPLKRFGVYEVTAEAAGRRTSLRVCRVPAPARLGPDASGLGINIFQQQVWWYAYQVPLMARVGVHWIRPWLAWENVWAFQEPQQGAWDTRALDAAARRMRSQGMRYQCILFSAPQWVTGTPGWNAPPVGKMGVWADYVRRLVSRYRGRIEHWEIWNEPDLMWPEETRHQGEHYVALLKAAYEAAKAADPRCVVLGLSHAGYMGWLEGVGAHGAAPYMDAATVHSYAAPREFVAAINERREVLARHGMGGKPLWINEIGTTAYDFSAAYSAKYDCSEAKQANVLAATYALCYSFDPRMKAFWFCTYDPRDAAHESDWTGDCGVGVLYLGFLPKLSYVALAGVSRETDGRRCLGRVDLPQPAGRPPQERVGLRQVSFEGPVALAWADYPDGARSVRATDLGCAAGEQVTVRDIFTNPVAEGRAGHLRLDLSRGPLYIEGSRQMAAVARAEASVSVAAERVALYPGQTSRVGLAVPAGVAVTVRADAGLPVAATVEAGEGPGARVLALTPQAGSGRASGMVRVVARFAEGQCGLLEPVDVARAVAVSIGVPNLIPDGHFDSPYLQAWAPERKSDYAWDADQGHLAAGALRLDGPFDRRLVRWDIVPTPGRALNLRAWVKTQAATGARVTLNICFWAGDRWVGTWCLGTTGGTGDIEGGWHISDQAGLIPTGTADWTEVSGVLPADKVPAGVTKAAFFIDAAGGGGGKVWLDDLDLWQPEG
jgi:hypothetical protein